MKINKNLKIKIEELHDNKIIVIDNLFEDPDSNENIPNDTVESKIIRYPLGNCIDRYQIENLQFLQDAITDEIKCNSIDHQFTKFDNHFVYDLMTRHETDESLKDETVEIKDFIKYKIYEAEELELTNIGLIEHVFDWFKKEDFFNIPIRPVWRFDKKYMGYCFLTDFTEYNSSIPDSEIDYKQQPDLYFWNSKLLRKFFPDELPYKWSQEWIDNKSIWLIFLYYDILRVNDIQIVNQEIFISDKDEEEDDKKNEKTLPNVIPNESHISISHVINEFDAIHKVDWVYNRAVFFEGSLFHSIMQSRFWPSQKHILKFLIN